MANEKRLIDANDVYKLFNRSGIATLHVGDIDTIQRVDAVEVVRCKDCRYFYRDDEFNRAWCGYDKCVANEVAVNGYCYRGERKDNE